MCVKIDENIIFISPYLHINEIQNFHIYHKDNNLYFEMIKFHSLELYPIFKQVIAKFLSLQSFRESRPDLYCLLITPDILLDNIKHNDLIDVRSKSKLFMFIKNIQSNPLYLDDFFNYWHTYYIKEIKTITLDINLWKTYDTLVQSNLKIGEYLYRANYGKIQALKDNNILFQIDMNSMKCIYNITNEVDLAEISFYLENTFYLKGIGINI